MIASAERLKLWREKPQVMVRELFGAEPQAFQDDALAMFPTEPRIAMKASRGPGKTTTLSWMAWNFLLTRMHPNIAATSITGDNLRDGLWKEMGVWRNKSPLLQAQFEITSERIFQKDHPRTWFMAARTWKAHGSNEELGNTLAGLHADQILFLLDESGSIPVAILASAEAALANANHPTRPGEAPKEAHIVQAGNTNSLEGSLYHACVKQAGLWKSVVISGDPDDPKRSTRVSVEWAREVIAQWGRESPFVKVMILGEWPEQSLNALFSANQVEAAMKMQYQEADIANSARILGVDVARSMTGAKSVIYPRQGLVMFPPHKMRGVNSVQGAGRIARVWNDWDVNACFVDNTGGFGAGWVDQLANLNRTAIGIGFAEAAEEPERYFNRRAEMYFRWSEWLKAGGGLPDDPELLVQLPAVTYAFKGDRLILEPKELIEAKIGYSPDEADAGALTFASPVAPRQRQTALSQRQEAEYDPFRRFMR